MAGSIADFKASFNTDLARPNRFDVNIPIPIGMLPYREIGRTLKMRCENAELPGRSISTTSMKIYGVDLQYKADYAVPLTVNQYDVKNELSYSVTMLDAFPIAMNQLDLDWSSDGHHKLTITFAYTSWRNNTVEALGMELLMTTIAESPNFPTYTLPSNLGRDLRTEAEIQASRDLGDFNG